MNQENQPEGQAQNVPTKKPWYKKWWGILLTIALFPLMVPYLVWTKTNWHKGIKIGITLVCILFFASNYYNDKKQEVADRAKQVEEARQIESIVEQAEGSIKENKIEEAIVALDKITGLDQNINKDAAVALRTKINELQNTHIFKRVLTSMSDSDFDLLQKGEFSASFIDHDELNRLFLVKLQENSNQRAVYIAEAEELKKKEQAETEKKKQEAEANARKEMLGKQFSAWDGSHIKLARMIKDSMNDPDSYEHVETRYWDMKDHLIVTTTFRGKNGFGGVVKNTVKAKVSLDGENIEILE